MRIFPTSSVFHDAWRQHRIHPEDRTAPQRIGPSSVSFAEPSQRADPQPFSSYERGHGLPCVDGGHAGLHVVPLATGISGNIPHRHHAVHSGAIACNAFRPGAWRLCDHVDGAMKKNRGWCPPFTLTATGW
eukprot:scaffold1_cov402-Prasinococcus_capsulatus_cf.AAC.24